MNSIRTLISSTITNSLSKRGRLSNLRLARYPTYLSYSTTASETGAKPVVDEGPISVSTPVGHEKVYDGKIVKLVDEISKLTLLEVADLNELLKKTLNIPDTPMMMGGPMMMTSQAKPDEDVEEAAPTKVQTQFTVKLLKFDDGKKVALIKEIKSLLEGMNLVQAKKFVESAPTTVKADISKDDAEKLAAALTAAGATCEIV